MSGDVIARRVVVHGRVQGVFFRDSCSSRARIAGVSGWVRNEPDGTVAAQFEGPEHAVELMLGWCSEGPPRASIERVDVTEVAPTGAASFDVLG